MKYFNKNIRDTVAAFHGIVTKLGDVKVQPSTAKSEEEANQLFDQGNHALLQVDEKLTLRDDVAIGRYLARRGSKKEQLLGASIFDQSKIDQWLAWTDQNVRFFAAATIDHLTGKAHEDTFDFKAANTNLRNAMKFLNSQLKDRKTLVGDDITIADIYLACHLVRSFQLVFETGFRKGIANVVNWFTEISNHEEFKNCFGKIKLCSRPLKPFTKEAEKPAKEGKDKSEKSENQNKSNKQDKGDKKGKGDKQEKGDKQTKGDNKGKGGKKGKGAKKEEEEEIKIGVPDDVQLNDPIYDKYKGVLKNAVYGQVVTRFPPEPSGFLHIGHIKAAMLNYHYSQIYAGKMILRFDDTNPTKEKIEFVQNIIKDLKTCEITPVKTTYTSDYFDQTQEKMREFIKMGMAYADNTPADQMKLERDEGIASANKTLPPKESLEIFEKMLEGNAPGWCIRANLDMTNKVKCLRDPVMYRCNDTPHHRTGSKYKAYPTYDFACPIVDALEGVTNCLRTIEYRDRDPLYHMIQSKLGFKPTEIFSYSKLQLKSTLMSKRKLQWFVDEGFVDGWNDPRFPTVQGLMRRGLTIQTLKEFMLEQGPSINTILMEWDKLWSTNKAIIDPISKRYYAIVKESAAEVIIENGPQTPEGITIDYHPKDPSLGSKVRILSSHLFIEREDVQDLNVGDKFTLSKWKNVVIKSKEEVDGRIRVVVELKPEDKDFKDTTKATFVSADDQFYVPVTIYEFGHLITKDSLKENDDVANFVNPNSRVKSEGYAEKDIIQAKVGDFIQIERRGYFYVDKDYRNHGEIVLHFIPDGKTKNMSKIASKIASNTLTKGEGEGGKAANRAEEAKAKGQQEGDEDKPLSKKQLKKLANKQKKKEKKQEHQKEGDAKGEQDN